MKNLGFGIHDAGGSCIPSALVYAFLARRRDAQQFKKSIQRTCRSVDLFNHVRQAHLSQLNSTLYQIGRRAVRLNALQIAGDGDQRRIGLLPIVEAVAGSRERRAFAIISGRSRPPTSSPPTRRRSSALSLNGCLATGMPLRCSVRSVSLTSAGI